MRRPAALLRPVRRAVLARRRLLAALLTAAAVAAGLQAAAAPPPAAVQVLVAARDLPSGTVLGAADVRTAGFAPGSVPEGATDLAEADGRTLAAPLRAGEPVTDVRLVGPSLTEGYPGLTAVPVRLPDPGVADLLAVGDRVDLLATDPEGGSAALVAADAPVLALPADDGGAGATGLGGRLVVLGVPPSGVPLVADAAARAFLSVALGG